jgi:hypothetical protein
MEFGSSPDISIWPPFTYPLHEVVAYVRQLADIWELEASPPEERRKRLIRLLLKILAAPPTSTPEKWAHKNGFVRTTVYRYVKGEKLRTLAEIESAISAEARERDLACVCS